MTTTEYDVQPGDILIIRDDNFTSWFIRFREWLLRKPRSIRRRNHVAIVSHWDDAGVLWAIEGKPSSVGYVTASKYLDSPELLTNAAQPKTPEQRAAIVKMAEAVNNRGGDYDWIAIGELAAEALRVLGLWKFPRLAPDWDDDEIPVHVICSSLADLCYESAGLDSPGGTYGTRFTSPSDWEAWINLEAWLKPEIA